MANTPCTTNNQRKLNLEITVCLGPKIPSDRASINQSQCVQKICNNNTPKHLNQLRTSNQIFSPSQKVSLIPCHK